MHLGRIVLALGVAGGVFWLALDRSPDLDREAPLAAPVVALTHPAEHVALRLVSEIRAGRYAETPYFFDADRQFSTELRVGYFRNLEDYVKPHEWQPFFTRLQVFEGRFDFVDVVLKTSTGESLVLIVEHDGGSAGWKVIGHEFPGLTFQKPEGLSFEQYVHHGIVETRRFGLPYRSESRPMEDVDYFIDYQGARRSS